jgi:limonene-1,2-epoxide hydrolase
MMFGTMLGGIGLKVALLAVLATAVGAAYWHYTIVRGERDLALQQVGALTVANEVQRSTIKGQEEAIANWAEAQARMQATLDALATAQVEANVTARRLNDVLSKHDLHALSLAKPGLVERRINSGTADILGLFESESGGANH